MGKKKKGNFVMVSAQGGYAVEYLNFDLVTRVNDSMGGLRITFVNGDVFEIDRSSLYGDEPSNERESFERVYEVLGVKLDKSEE